MNKIDIFIQQYFYTARTPELTQFFYSVTSLFDLTIYFVLFLMFVALVIYTVRNLKYAVFFLTTIAFGTGVVYVMKLFFNVNRPPEPVMFVFGQSFPSYHATISVVFFILLMYVFDDYLRGVWRKIFNLFCLVSIFLVSLSRIYLGVHWFSDVFFGVFLGCLIVYLAIKIFKRVIIVQDEASMLK
ncbi:MAG: putative membrane integrated acid phosphatase family protein [Parcubacteria group bacterium Gr01-1014_46]|nr:MAG: putative membrane integrated acid phosphatase family protein [Parcubacteria group bacterium Gr01-1014_46]